MASLVAQNTWRSAMLKASEIADVVVRQEDNKVYSSSLLEAPDFPVILQGVCNSPKTQRVLGDER